MIDIHNIWNVQVSTLHKVWTSVKFFWYFLSVRMMACALVLVHDFPVMYFVLKSCTLFAKKVIGRNSRKLVAAKYYWRSNTLLIFHILPYVSLENVSFCFHSGYQCFLLVNENMYWNLIWAKELELNISMPQILKLHNRFGLNNKTSYAKLYFLL